MTDTTQPEALRLAEILEGDYCPDWFYEQGVDEVAAELRRLHARVVELEAQAPMAAPRVSHLNHCNTGEYVGSCKYGDDECPAFFQTPQPEAQAPAVPAVLNQILLDPENQPNQYGVRFLMSGEKFAFQIGNQRFALDYEPTEPGEFEFMRDMLIHAFSTFTPDVKAAPQPEAAAGPTIDYGQFLSDVMTAAGLVAHGKQCKALSDRLSDMVMRLRAAPQPEAQAVPDLEEALRERDAAEDFIDYLLDEVLGHERPEWSSAYGRDHALSDVRERITALHKPAVDKAWDQFQSAMAVPQQAAPMSPINRMIAYSAATKLRELGFAWDEASEAWLNPAAPQQAAPAAEWLEQAYREGWAACRDAETIGQEAEDWAFGNSTANSRMIDMQQAAPQQEVQEPPLPAPPECKTEGERRAYAFGWWRALEANRAQPAPSGDAEQTYAQRHSTAKPASVVDKRTKLQMTAEVLRRMDQQEDGHNSNPFRPLLERLMRNEGGYSTTEIGQLKYALDGFYGAARKEGK